MCARARARARLLLLISALRRFSRSLKRATCQNNRSPGKSIDRPCERSSQGNVLPPPLLEAARRRRDLIPRIVFPIRPRVARPRLPYLGWLFGFLNGQSGCPISPSSRETDSSSLTTHFWGSNPGKDALGLPQSSAFNFD